MGIVVFALLSSSALSLSARADVPLDQAKREKLLSIARKFVDKVGTTLTDPQMQFVDTTDPNGNVKALESYEEGEVLLLDINLGRMNLDQAISAVRHGKNLYISLSEFVAAARFPIEVNPADGKASGWYIREKQIFALDAKARTVSANGRNFAINSVDIQTDDTDIWVRGGALAQWFDFDLNTNVRMQAMHITPRQKWVVQEQADRAKRMGAKSIRTPPPKLPRLKDDYEMASIPNASVSIRNTYTNMTSSATPPTQSKVAVQAAGDLLKHTAKTTVTASRENTLESVFLNLSKSSEQDDLLGFMKARRYEVGDINSVPVPFAGSAPSEWGVRATNRDPYNTSQATTQVEGEAPIGWDVELFRNDQFVGVVRADENGRYVFEDVFLFVGENRFRIVKYGPQGEIQEEDQAYAVATNRDSGGKGLYDVSLSAQNTRTWLRLPSRDVDKKTPHLAATYEKQISPALSAHAGVQARQEQKHQKLYVDTGILTTYRGAIVNADAIIDADGFFKVVTAARRRFGQQNTALVLSYDGENFNPGSGGVPRPASVSLNAVTNGPVPGFKPDDFNYGANSTYTIRDNNSAQYSSSFDLTKRVKRMSFNHRISRSVEEFPNGSKSERIEGQFGARGRVAKTLLRGSVGYEVVPESNVTEIAASAARSLNKNLGIDLSVKHRPVESYSIGDVSLDWTAKRFVLSPSVSYDTDSALNAGLDVRFGLSQNPVTGDVIMDNRGLVGVGGITARVFLDHDGDKMYTKGDTLLPGIVVEALQSRREAETDEQGNAYIYNLPADRVTDVQVQEGGNFDYSWVMGFDGVSIRPRPGHVAHVEFPIWLSGELDGTIYSATPDGKGSPVRNMHLTLYRLNGKVEQSTMCGPDGYYLFTRVPPGKYFLMVDAEEAKKRRLSAPVPPLIEIGLDGTILSGKNIILEPNGLSISVAMGAPAADYKAQYPEVAVALPKDGQLVLNLGEYKSGLLLSLMWYRLKSRYRDLVGDADLIVPMTATARHSAEMPQILRVSLPEKVDMAEAHRRCEVLVSRGFSCGVEIVPAVAG